MGGGSNALAKPSAAGKVDAVGFVPEDTQELIAANAVTNCGPVKAQCPLPVV